jgi:hypothetical protein
MLGVVERPEPLSVGESTGSEREPFYEVFAQVGN